MNCSKRTRIKILSDSTLIKKMGILNEQEYKGITKAFRI